MHIYRNSLILGLLATGLTYGMEKTPDASAQEAQENLQVIAYERQLHEQGIRDILQQKTPEGKPYTSVVGGADRIINALQDGAHRGYVLYDAEAQRVAGFIVCSQSANRSNRTDTKSEWWYVDWLALHQDYQGQHDPLSAHRSNATLLWEQVVRDATEMGLPIMLNTLVTNTRMQAWCIRRGMREESAEHSKYPKLLKYYSYRIHVSQPQPAEQKKKIDEEQQKINSEPLHPTTTLAIRQDPVDREQSPQQPAEIVHTNTTAPQTPQSADGASSSNRTTVPPSTQDAPPPTTQAQQPHKQNSSWLYRYRYPLTLGIGIITGCILFLGYKFSRMSKKTTIGL